MIRKFFLVDDDEDDTDLFGEALRDIDPLIEFYSASNGKELLDRLKSGEFSAQVIFLDINMPGMTGWEALESLKNSNLLKEVPVIMYSTSSSDKDAARALELGALGFYEKPSNFLNLKDFLKLISVSSAAELKSTLKKIASSSEHKVFS